MTIKLGSVDINQLYLGSTEIKKAYLGSTLLYDKTGGAFSPSDITGYELEFIGSSLDSAGLSDGDTVTSGTWDDETGTYSFNTTNTPSYETNELNGKSIVRYSNTEPDRHTLDANVNFGQKYSFVAVFKDGSSGAGIKIAIRTGGTEPIEIRTADSGSIVEWRCDNGPTRITAGVSGLTRGDWWIVIGTCDFSTGDVEVFVNSDTASATGSGSTGTAPGNAQLLIPSNAIEATIDLAHVILYNGHVVSSSEVADLNNYLGTLYNITIS